MNMRLNGKSIMQFLARRVCVCVASHVFCFVDVCHVSGLDEIAADFSLLCLWGELFWNKGAHLCQSLRCFRWFPGSEVGSLTAPSVSFLH